MAKATKTGGTPDAPEQNFELHRFEDAKLAYFTFEGLVEWLTLKKAIRYAYEEEVVVLVSEFNEGIMRLYQHLSSRSGFTVERAWSLPKALDLLEEKPPPEKVRERL